MQLLFTLLSLCTNLKINFFRLILMFTFFKSIKETHNHNTRLSSRMTSALPKIRTNYGLFNIRYQGAKICNAISDIDDIKLLPLKQFKNKIKLNIIASYEFNMNVYTFKIQLLSSVS